MGGTGRPGIARISLPSDHWQGQGGQSAGGIGVKDGVRRCSDT